MAPLNALDRCNRCGAQAYVLAALAGSEWLLCAHHAREHESKMVELGGSFLVDDRDDKAVTW